MEGLIKASSFNFGRMLYGDGSGKLATISSVTTGTLAVKVDSVRNLIEGMVVDFYSRRYSQLLEQLDLELPMLTELQKNFS